MYLRSVRKRDRDQVSSLSQRETFQYLVKRSGGLQETLEVDEFLDISVEVSFLLDAIVDLLEQFLVDQRLDATNGEVWDEVLSVAEIAKVIEGIEYIGL